MTLTSAAMTERRIIELKLCCLSHRAETTIKPKTTSTHPQYGGESMTFSTGSVQHLTQFPWKRAARTRMLADLGLNAGLGVKGQPGTGSRYFRQLKSLENPPSLHAQGPRVCLCKNSRNLPHHLLVSFSHRFYRNLWCHLVVAETTNAHVI